MHLTRLNTFGRHSVERSRLHAKYGGYGGGGTRMARGESQQTRLWRRTRLQYNIMMTSCSHAAVTCTRQRADSKLHNTASRWQRVTSVTQRDRLLASYAWLTLGLSQWQPWMVPGPADMVEASRPGGGEWNTNDGTSLTSVVTSLLSFVSSSTFAPRANNKRRAQS